MKSVIAKPTGKRKPGMTASPDPEFQYKAVQEFSSLSFSTSTAAPELEGQVHESMLATKRSQLSRVRLLTIISSSLVLLVIIFVIGKLFMRLLFQWSLKSLLSPGVN